MNAANDEGVSGFSPTEKLAIRAVLDGASFGDAANSTGLPVDQVECICTRYHNGLAEAMKQGAIQFIADSLDNSPAPADTSTPATPKEATPASGLTTRTNPDGTVTILDEKGKALDTYPADQVEAKLEELREAPKQPYHIGRVAINKAKSTLISPLTATQNDQLSDAVQALHPIMAGMPVEERGPWVTDQIEAWLAPIREQQEAGIEQHDSTPDEGRHAAMDSPPRDMWDEILEEIGLPRWEDIPETDADRVRMQAEKRKRQDSTPDGARPAAMDSPPKDFIDQIWEDMGFRDWDDIPETDADRVRMQAEKQQRQEALKRNPQT
jgi:hypothetical protein